MPPRVSRSAAATNLTSLTILQEAPQCCRCQHRSFSSTPSQSTRLRREMFAWLNGPGKAFMEPLPGTTNYLGGYDKKGRLLRQKDEKSETNELEKETIQDLRPFPLNKDFYSQSILSEELRNEIYRRVKVLGQPIRTVSTQLGVELRRVGAVVRLVELENRWKAEGKSLAIPYARAVHEMVPTTPYTPGKPTPHESINDLPVHPATDPQIFWPTSESRQFNRTDAGRVFSGAHLLPDGESHPSTQKPGHFEIVGKPGYEREVLLPADARIPHPHLIEYHKDMLNPEFKGNRELITKRHEERIQEEAQKTEAAKLRRKELEEKKTNRVGTERWDFLFKEVQATREGTGLDGRGTKSPGFRYGLPREDRKRGQVKIPKRVTV